MLDNVGPKRLLAKKLPTPATRWDAVITLSGTHRRYGYRMLHATLVREGFKVTVKVVYQIYLKERLWLRRIKAQEDPEGRMVPDWAQPTVVFGFHL